MSVTDNMTAAEIRAIADRVAVSLLKEAAMEADEAHYAFAELTPTRLGHIWSYLTSRLYHYGRLAGHSQQAEDLLIAWSGFANNATALANLLQPATITD